LRSSEWAEVLVVKKSRDRRRSLALNEDGCGRIGVVLDRQVVPKPARERRPAGLAVGVNHERNLAKLERLVSTRFPLARVFKFMPNQRRKRGLCDLGLAADDRSDCYAVLAPHPLVDLAKLSLIKR
jgi:hypothetical protein